MDVRMLMRSGMVKMSLHFSLGNSLSGCSPLDIEASLQMSNSDEPSPVLNSGDTEEKNLTEFTTWWEVQSKLLCIASNVQEGKGPRGQRK